MKKFDTRTLSLLAMLTAISIILSRLLGFYVTESMRMSFEYFPIILAGICFGPLAGAVVGGLADFLGSTVLSGLGFYPPLIVGPVMAGLTAGIMAQYILKNRLDSWWRVMLAVLIPDLLCNMLWGTYALTALYNSPFPVLLAARAPLKLIVAIIDAQLVYAVHRALRPLLRRSPGRA